jgi:hypothetical protein
MGSAADASAAGLGVSGREGFMDQASIDAGLRRRVKRGNEVNRSEVKGQAARAAEGTGG